MIENQTIEADPEMNFGLGSRQCAPENDCVEGYDTGIKYEQRWVAVGVQFLSYGKCVQIKQCEGIYPWILSTSDEKNKSVNQTNARKFCTSSSLKDIRYVNDFALLIEQDLAKLL